MKKELLKEYCESEFENIDIIIKEIGELLLKAPDLNKIELVALGTFIHNFYNGIENILKRIFQYKNIILKDAPGYHKFLLKKAKEESIINDALCNSLYKFLTFRHFFIHGYSFMIELDKLRILVDNIENTYKNFKLVIHDYINSLA